MLVLRQCYECMTTYSMFIRDYWRLQNAVCAANVWDVVEAAEDLNSLDMSWQQKSQTCWLGAIREYS